MDLPLSNAVSHVILRGLVISEINFEVCHEIEKKGIDNLQVWIVKNHIMSKKSTKLRGEHLKFLDLNFVKLGLGAFLTTPRFSMCSMSLIQRALCRLYPRKHFTYPERSSKFYEKHLDTHEAKERSG